MRYLPLIALIFLAAACERAPADPRGVAANETLLTVNATGRADTRPDEARLQLGVQSDAPTAGDASRLNREKMDRVTGALARLGVKADDLQTRNLSLNRINYGAERGRFRAYNMVEVTLRDMAKVGEAVTAVTEAGANVLSGPNLRVSDREAANRSAYGEAYKAARAKAEAYAQAAGLEINRVLAIYDGGEMPQGYDMNASAEMTRQVSAPPPPAVQRGNELDRGPGARRLRTEALGERGRPAQQLISLDHLAEASFVGTVASVLVRMIAAHEVGVALAKRVPVGVVAKAEHRQRTALGRVEPRCATRIANSPEAPGDRL
jgi:uncharacterized protein YggE